MKNSRTISFLIFFLVTLFIQCADAQMNSDEALMFAQKVTLEKAIHIAKDFASKNRSYWNPYIVTGVELEKAEQGIYWSITLTSVNKKSWRQPEVVRVFNQNLVDEKPGK